MVVTGGQRNDGAMMQDTLKDIYVPRPTGRPRTTPDTVMADRGYTSGVNREYLRDHHVKAVIPQKKNEIASRKKKGSKGGHPPAFDAEAYKGRNVVERSFNSVKQWRGLATRYDKLAVTYRSATVLHAILQWLQIEETRPREVSKVYAGTAPFMIWRRTWLVSVVLGRWRLCK